MANSVITVSQLNFYIRSLLESDSRLALLRVSGEISNFKEHYSSGHLYFSLKDSGGVVRCVMFKANASRLKAPLKDGMKVVALGRVSVYERDGTYQLYAEDIIPEGAGDLYAKLEEIKKRLEAEGLFDVSRKFILPKFPKIIAVITSDTGAAVRDIINVLSRRWPLADILLCPSLVQGKDAPESLISALDIAEKSAADVIIIGRGGGSIEDLWCFNDEGLARRISRCTKPVISAVGHETDFTICDFVSDMRAPTPSAAAEIAVPDIAEITASVRGYEHLIKMRTSSAIHLYDAKLSRIETMQVFRDPKAFITEKCKREAARLLDRMKNTLDKRLVICEKNFVTVVARLESLSPLKTMARGYAVANKNGKTIRSKTELAAGDIINLRLKDGKVHCEVKEVE